MPEISEPLRELLIIITFIILYYAKEFWKKLKSKRINSYVGSATRAEETHALLEGVRVHYKADWSFYGNFHNGKNYSDGRSFKEFSIQYLRTSKHVAKPFDWPKSCLQIPLAMGMSVFGIIKNDKIFDSIEATDYYKDDFFKNLFELNEIKRAVIAPVFRNGDLYGFVGIAWSNYRKIHKLIDTAYLLTTSVRLSKYNLRKKSR